MKPTIGIVTNRKIFNESRPFKDVFTYVNNFPKRIAKAGGIPIGMLFPDGKYEEEYLEMCDGFLIPGGSQIWSYQLAVIHYAITHNKPLLGICLGHQALGVYSFVVDKLTKQGIEVTCDKIIKFYETIDKDELLFLHKIEGHDLEPEFHYYSILKSKHKVFIDENSYLYDIYKTKEIEEPSIHSFIIKESGQAFKVTATSKEGYIEGIEYKDQNHFIVGVQFHPELEDNNDKLFERLITEAKKRKWYNHFFLLQK